MKKIWLRQPTVLFTTQGGMAVVSDEKILSSMPLQMAGIVSTDSFETVLENFANLNTVLADTGCKFKKPHLIPLFFAVSCLARYTNTKHWVS